METWSWREPYIFHLSWIIPRSKVHPMEFLKKWTQKWTTFSFEKCKYLDSQNEYEPASGVIVNFGKEKGYRNVHISNLVNSLKVMEAWSWREPYIFHLSWIISQIFFTFGQNWSAQLGAENGSKLLKNDVKKRVNFLNMKISRIFFGLRIFLYFDLRWKKSHEICRISPSAFGKYRDIFFPRATPSERKYRDISLGIGRYPIHIYQRLILL